MNNSQIKRMWVIALVIAGAGLVIVGRLFAFQLTQGEEFKKVLIKELPVTDQPERGVIYDRNGAILAVDRWDYRVAVSPSVLTDPEALADSLAPILQIRRSELLYDMESPNMYVVLAPRVTADVADAIRELEYGDEIQLDPLPRRFYPQDKLMCHVLGFVNFDNTGSAGVEGEYQKELAGEEASATVPISPLKEQGSVIAREGSDIVLTIDRSVQYVVERHLKEALAEHGAVSGSIIVMDPRTGEILAMAAEPCYSPNEFYDLKEGEDFNPLVSAVYEPGSVMKLITMAAALDSGTVTPTTTYNDTGAIEVGGHISYNWDRGAHGVVDMTTLLARSLNVGAATIATWMGPTTFYDYLQRFGFGHSTNIDIANEAEGLMPLPGSDLWQESFIATNAYGQALAVTSIQMISAISALANDGRLMQPHVVSEIRDEFGTRHIEPIMVGQIISENTAAQMTAMATVAVQQEVQEALVEGYTVAGKTGTAQIAEAFGYHPTDVIGSFVGWLPADDPQIVVYVKLDRPQSAPWGSMTAAPVFSKLAKELVVLLDIPPDAVRLQAGNPTGGGG
ncbi:MAG TPA: penicillin-binding protein 2 [Promineifilum sp.]|nr:penicillin-binding protein 2 [Promineifilum sp.]HRQ14701.1 penicillin-binding protein 2 [Promineifilum sp.]